MQTRSRGIRELEQPVLLGLPFDRAARVRMVVHRHPVRLGVLDQRGGDVRQPLEFIICRQPPPDPVATDEDVRLAAELGPEIDHPLLHLGDARLAGVIDLHDAEHRDRGQAHALEHRPHARGRTAPVRVVVQQLDALPAGLLDRREDPLEVRVVVGPGERVVAEAVRVVGHAGSSGSVGGGVRPSEGVAPMIWSRLGPGRFAASHPRGPLPRYHPSERSPPMPAGVFYKPSDGWVARRHPVLLGRRIPPLLPEGLPRGLR